MTTEIQQRAQDELKQREAKRSQVKKAVTAQSEIQALVIATNKEKADAKDVARLRQYLTDHPDELALLGNLATQVEGEILATEFRFSDLLITAAQEYCDKMRDDMGYQGASLLERGLIDNIVLCWVRLHVAEFSYNRYTKGVTLAQAEFWEKKLGATQKRYLRAVETLARVRRLLKEPQSPVLNMLLAQQFNQR